MEINVFMQKLQIKHKTCYIDQNGSDGPIILWGMYPHRGNEIAHMWECLMETVNDQDFLLCAFQVEDWNGDFSPWKAPAAFGNIRSDKFLCLLHKLFLILESGRSSTTVKFLDHFP